jgi:hypothetical protein
MDLTQQADIQQTYWLLFDKMKDDFVGKEDLELALQSSFANGGIQGTSGGAVVVSGAKVTVPLSDTLANQKAFLYSQKARSGGAVREEGVKALEEITS